METSIGTRLPLSSRRPGQTATTSPCWGFSLAVSGMTRPLAVISSCFRGVITMRSARVTRRVVALPLGAVAALVGIGVFLRTGLYELARGILALTRVEC